jgi:hypothetical protein
MHNVPFCIALSVHPTNTLCSTISCNTGYLYNANPSIHIYIVIYQIHHPPPRTPRLPSCTPILYIPSVLQYHSAQPYPYCQWSAIDNMLSSVNVSSIQIHDKQLVDDVHLEYLKVPSRTPSPSHKHHLHQYGYNNPRCIHFGTNGL